MDEELNQHHGLIRWGKRLTGRMYGENAEGMSRPEQSTNFVPSTLNRPQRAVRRGWRSPFPQRIPPIAGVSCRFRGCRRPLGARRAIPSDLRRRPDARDKHMAGSRWGKMCNGPHRVGILFLPRRSRKAPHMTGTSNQQPVRPLLGWGLQTMCRPLQLVDRDGLSIRPAR